MHKRRHHRFEARCFNGASGFQTVWRPFTEHIQPKGKTSKKRMNSHNLYLLSHILRDGLLTRKFNQAIAAMVGMSGCCEKVIELFALAGLEILKTLPNNHLLVVKFYKDMFLACGDHQVEILLNFALYLVVQQHDVLEALELLKSKANKPKFRESLLHKAYIGLFEYLVNEKNSVNSTKLQDMYDSDEEQDNWLSQTTQSQRNLNFSWKQSMVLFQDVFSNPGVWDQFVPTYLELLKCQEEEGLVRRFLCDYKNNNPTNPNSHRYLYHYMKNHSASLEEKANLLEDLIKIDPSSELIKDFVEYKIELGDTASAVKTIFEKLDHSVNMFCEESWTLLHFFIYNGCKQTTESKVKETLKLCWSERESWWPEYHFRMTTNTQCHEGNHFSINVYEQYRTDRNDEEELFVEDERTSLDNSNLP
ncbi:TATA box-binding protein-associated factor RNA polymerase I subunit A-like isoform X2 [Xenia sp. Carnegie-2017]|uniref:TATA box-binding protein-associated factor RNA polymerase I subunit A-like isoform X2 n=1 Tax=Xenia sp. Carnegie-2017 TaxID=2897299 RepID=UPI001F03B407|nr:TATA box-binding protein-associated factor RNA polymerase I subunit A-like isoform X2 [Xenia sp. Carnegie-2017]